MEQPLITPEARYEALVKEFATVLDTQPGPGRGFGSSELKVHSKIFAMLVKDRLVVKLPKSRVDELVAAGQGERFDPRRNGKPMKEWVCVETTFEGGWSALAREALDFVTSNANVSPKKG